VALLGVKAVKAVKVSMGIKKHSFPMVIRLGKNNYPEGYVWI
jgi:hypothetical protein